MPPRQANPQQQPYPPMWPHYPGAPQGYGMPPGAQGYQPHYPYPPMHPGMMGMPPGSMPPGMGMPMAPPAAPPPPVGKQRRKRKKQPEGGPKKPATSFVLFSNTMREQVKQDHPGLSFTELGRKLGEMWREMDPNIRKDYEDRATAAKDRYLEEKKAWLAQRAAQGQGMYSQE